MNDEGGRQALGRRIEERRRALGIRSHADFSRQTGIARATIRAAEAGTASDVTYDRLGVWLAAQESLRRSELSDPADILDDMADRIEFEVTGPRTEWHVKVSGPTEQADELRRQVVELLREWHDETP